MSVMSRKWVRILTRQSAAVYTIWGPSRTDLRRLKQIHCSIVGQIITHWVILQNLVNTFAFLISHTCESHATVYIISIEVRLIEVLHVTEVYGKFSKYLLKLFATLIQASAHSWTLNRCKELICNETRHGYKTLSDVLTSFYRAWLNRV